MFDYDSAEYAADRLVGTVVRCKGIPVTVRACRGSRRGILISSDNIITGERLEDTPINEFDFEPVELGYVNTREQTAYVCRMPMRRGTRNQGLRIDNITCIGGRLLDLNFKDLGKTIIGVYPSLEECYEECNFYRGRAFSRKFALVSGENNIRELLYKDKKVGVCDKKLNLLLNPGYLYLKETLDATMRA